MHENSPASAPEHPQADESSVVQINDQNLDCDQIVITEVRNELISGPGRKKTLVARIYLNFEEEPWLSAPVQIIDKLQLDVGRVLEREEIRAIEDLVDDGYALKRAYHLLSYKQLFSWELRDKLIAGGSPARIVEEVITELTHLGYLKDQDLAKDIARAAKEKHKGPLYITRKLMKRGMGWEDALHIAEEVWGEEDQEFVAAKLSEVPEGDYAQRRKVIGKLLRDGFSID